MNERKPVPDILIERLVLGELSKQKAEEVRKRLEREPGGLERLEKIKEHHRQFLAEYPKERMMAEVNKRINKEKPPVKAKAAHIPQKKRITPGRVLVHVFVLCSIIFVLSLIAIPNFTNLGGKMDYTVSSKSLSRQARLAEEAHGYTQDGEIPDEAWRYNPNFNTESYDHIVENDFRLVNQHPLSTFSIDVDTASYSNVRRFLQNGNMPPPGSVRIEELINYFDYDYPLPEGKHPFSVNVEIADCPWQNGHKLTRIGLKGKDIPLNQRPPTNLVFLIDVSGSMKPKNKLPLLKKAFALLTEQLTEKDSVAMVVYAGSSGLVLPPTPGDNQRKIHKALKKLESGGSTNGGAGIRLAYMVARENFIEGGTNRVILATDGDFNVGITNQGDLIRMIEKEAESGVFLTVLGFGMGNYKDSTLEKLADKGNGNYAYIDTYNEAQKVFSRQLTGTLFTIAKDVKIQIEFNPARVQAYRLIGYENRILKAEDFNDDKKDAGEIGAGHTVTALYQIVPKGADIGFDIGSVDKLKYQKPVKQAEAAGGPELMTVKLRYKEPDGQISKLIEMPVRDTKRAFENATSDFRFAASVASFGMLLRDSKYKGSVTYSWVAEIANTTRGEDPFDYRKEFLSLVEDAADLSVD